MSDLIKIPVKYMIFIEMTVYGITNIQVLQVYRRANIEVRLYRFNMSQFRISKFFEPLIPTEKRL